MQFQQTISSQKKWFQQVKDEYLTNLSKGAHMPRDNGIYCYTDVLVYTLPPLGDCQHLHCTQRIHLQHTYINTSTHNKWKFMAFSFIMRLKLLANLKPKRCFSR